MLQLLGEYECRLDEKGRLKLPAPLIKQLADKQLRNFVLNRGFEPCLMLYPEPTWQQISQEINQLNQYSKQNRDFIRYFYRGASPVEADAMDRILVNKRLLEYAEIQKDLVLFAYDSKIEIWAKEKYEKLLNQEPSDFSDLAELVLGKNK